MKRITLSLTSVFVFALLVTTQFPVSLRAAPVPNLAPPPPGALVLFDGTNTAAWVKAANGGTIDWPVTQGALEVNPQGVNSNSIRTLSVFQDFQLHAEFLVPPGGNSGIYLQSRYEIQIFASPTNGSLGISDFPHQDHIRGLPEHGPDDAAEVQADRVPYFTLVDPRQVVFHGVFGGDDFAVWAVQFT